MAAPQHQDDHPWTWEPAAAFIAIITAVAILSIQLGRSIALLLTGAGWRWPDTSTLVTSTWPILTGNTLAGLHATNDAPPSPQWVVWACAATLFTGTILIASVGIIRWLTTSRHKGMASTTEAQQLLGRSRLRAHRTIIRPDLYRKNHR